MKSGRHRVNDFPKYSSTYSLQARSPLDNFSSFGVVDVEEGDDDKDGEGGGGV